MTAKPNRMLTTAQVLILIVIIAVSASGCLGEKEEYIYDNSNSLISQEVKVDQNLKNDRSSVITLYVPIDQNVPAGLETATFALG